MVWLRRLQRQSIARAFRALAAACAALACVATLGSAQSGPPGASWREDASYVALFAPRAERDAYRAFTSPQSLAETLAAVRADSRSQHPPGAWTPRGYIPFDAFGLGGTYDRWSIARLYGATRAMVARGPRGGDGPPTEMWTLISPYPSRELDRLERGTLLLVLRLP